MAFHLDPEIGVGRWMFSAAGDPDPYFVTMGFIATDLTAFHAFIDTMASSWNTNIKSSTSSDQTLVQTDGNWSPDGTVINNYIKTSGVVGTGGTGVLPSNCSVLVKKVTGVGGRSNNGRSYWPNGVIAETNVDANGVISSGTLSTLQTHFTALINDLIAVSGAHPIIVHQDPNGPHPPGTQGPNVTGYVVQSTIATQRRRMR